MSSPARTLEERLLVACVAGCTCDTKTPDIEHHDELCHYRLFREAARGISDSQRWIPVEERMPESEQTVLACWVGPSACNPGMETLIYHAADAPDCHERWLDVFDEERDPPTHWTLKELPK